MKAKPWVLCFILLTSCASSSTSASSSMNPSTSTSNSEPLKILNVNLYEGYASYPIRAFFGNEPIADPDLYYEIEDESICEISNNMAIPLQIGTSQVIASTDDGRETTFIVRVKSHTELRFHADVLSREEEFNLTVNPEPSPTLFIGDSFFDPRVFWRSFYDDFEGLNCFSAGISGSKADDWIHFRERLIDNISPKQIVMHIGTNDVNDSENPTFKPLDYYKQITRFLDLVLSESPDVKIYFFGIENRSGSSGYESKNLYVEAVTKMIEEEFAPAYPNQFVYMDSPAVFNADQQRYLSSDGIHPSPEGYAYYVSFLKGLLEF